ncbi:hypothetical protein [Haloglomus litoreum]|uniref:hypothetical protein n=1 Tax=Haloglomus litoreum TaxID=3034026 RepID=UPI0023E8EE3E|nr:hypothetical protein [Haloglomus sp. DT116]
MTDATESGARDPLAPFDADILAAVAGRTGTDPAHLRELLRRHQQSARDLPGVDNLVYEWRKYLPYDPVVARTEAAFHCVVLPEVWADFAEALDIDDADFERLLAVHDRQARRAAEARGESTEPFDGATAMLLTRA